MIRSHAHQSHATGALRTKATLGFKGSLQHLIDSRCSMVGRPGFSREVRRGFWEELRVGGTITAAAARVGVNRSTAANWVSEAGGMIPLAVAPTSTRLSFLDRGER